VNLALCSRPRHRKPPMHQESLRLLIQRKINAGRLPRVDIPRIWGAYAHGESCAACEETIGGATFFVEGLWIDREVKRTVQFHVKCFSVWDELRRIPGT
jgi:hypothetical protein